MSGNWKVDKNADVAILSKAELGGGVLICVKSVFTYSLVFKGTTDLELIVASFVCTMQGTSPDFTLALFYRPPNFSSFVIDSLFTVLCNLNVSIFSNFYFLCITSSLL